MPRRDSGRAVMIALSAAALLGCASGAVSGRVSLAGQQASPLTMTWNSGLFGESGKMSAVMPDGERFSGKYTVVSPGITRSSLEPAWTGDEPGENQGQIDDSMWGAGRDAMTFIKTYENKAVATLKGDRGTTMLCRFNLDAGGAGMGGGGTGECQTSKGAKITASF
ncbi:MAG TPA: hypothetical protein VGV06_13860 [Methylomirabilota bacterium]|nr:hypothetical protein [Methylomirabilota bacterium]